GAFIKQCRNSRDPKFFSNGKRRRRTAGWTRKEVAERANISIDWYTKLEQGYSVSYEVLKSVMDALQMSSAERATVLALSRDTPVESTPISKYGLSQAIERYLGLHDYVPIYVMNERWDIVAWNPVADYVLGGFSGTESKERNVVRLIFCNPTIKALMGKVWERQARHLVREFRITYRQHRGDEFLEQLVREVSEASAEFRSWWNAEEGEFGAEVYSVKQLAHPELGALDLEQVGLIMQDAPHLRIILHMPINKVTKDKLKSWHDRSKENRLTHMEQSQNGRQYGSRT
ncbi:MAG: helix-turn-helix domain-containing protein, partial [Anaerolineales bacterium]|nr:helix-turn-helix domain-containing protein [Anaerolineales bacterium]